MKQNFVSSPNFPLLDKENYDLPSAWKDKQKNEKVQR